MHEKSLFTGYFPEAGKLQQHSVLSVTLINHTILLHVSHLSIQCERAEKEAKWDVRTGGKRVEGEEGEEVWVELACVILICLFISV